VSQAFRLFFTLWHSLINREIQSQSDRQWTLMLEASGETWHTIIVVWQFNDFEHNCPTVTVLLYDVLQVQTHHHLTVKKCGVITDSIKTRSHIYPNVRTRIKPAGRQFHRPRLLMIYYLSWIIGALGQFWLWLLKSSTLDPRILDLITLSVATLATKPVSIVSRKSQTFC